MMKRIFVSFLLLLGLASGIQAQDAAFLAGNEDLTYSIRHSYFPGNVGTMTFQGRDMGGSYQVDAALKASIVGIYRLESTYGAVFHKDEALTPVSATRTQKENKYWAKGAYDWSAPGSVHLYVTKSTRDPRDEELTWSGTVRDLLNMIWWLRSLDYSQASLETGRNALLLDHDALPVTIASYTKGTYKYKGEQIPVIEVLLSQEGKEALRVTISDDASRRMLKFSIALSIGTIRGTLK